MTRTSTCILALLSVLATSRAVNAAGYFHQTRQMVVSYSDLNISNPSGAETLLSRIRYAADSVCGGTPDLRNLNAWENYRTCDKQAMDQAIAAVNSPLVAQLYGVPGLNTDEALSRVADNN